LLAFLQHGPSAVPIDVQNPNTHNTISASGRYGYRDIRSVGIWSDFNIHEIMRRYGALLTTSGLQDNPFRNSPMDSLTTESTLVHLIARSSTDRVQEALRCGFALLNPAQHARFSVVYYGAGEAAARIERCAPDLAFYDPHLPSHIRPNRLPGDVKPSYKWNTGLANSPSHTDRKEYKQVLSQVNYYMIQHQARYGFILTNRELVAIRRLDNHGNLQLAAPVPWTASGTATHPQLTVLLALWTLGMLSSDNQDWSLNPSFTTDF
ncbi:uncharacterized protein BO66DRAFT_335634, partial [Aspergillus aculeatinus CBS 121060]